MPIYGYRCESCGRDIDVVHAIAAVGPTTCEVCGGTLRKTLSTPAIHFKGSGWAKKDASAGTSGGKAAAKADGEQATGAAAKSETAATPSDASSNKGESSSARGDTAQGGVPAETAKGAGGTTTSATKATSGSGRTSGSGGGSGSGSKDRARPAE